MKKNLGIVLLSFFLLSGTKEIMAAPPTWAICMKTCQSALDKKHPDHAAWRMQREDQERDWRNRSSPTTEEFKRLKNSGDDGRSFEHFKICHALCKGTK